MVEKEKAREHLNRWGIHKSMGADVMHPWVVKDLTNVIVRPLSIIFEMPW